MRHERARAVAVVLVLMCAFGVAFTDARQTPARDLPKPQVGTGSISGRVVSNDAKQEPIRRAILLLNGGDLTLGRQTTTDEEGRFVMSALPPGRYTLTAWRNGFVRDVYGNKRAGIGPGAPIVLGGGQQVTLTFRMTRSAVITGRILPSALMPSHGIQVTPLQYAMVGGRRVLKPTSGGVSPISGMGGTVDDRGIYRIYGLPPGSYVISAYPNGAWRPIRPVASDEVEWATQQFQSSTTRTPAPPTSAGRPGLAFAEVYYPGTTDPAEAVAITVGAGEERSGVDFAVHAVPLVSVEGNILGPDGQMLLRLDVTLVRTGTDRDSPAEDVRLSGGQFVAPDVPPGHYTLFAQAASRGAPSAAAGRGDAPVRTLFGMTEFDVDGRDIGGLSVTLEPGVSVSGRLAFQGQAPLDMQRVRIRLESTQSLMRNVTNFMGQPAADGTFTIAGVAPGTYRATASASSPWTAKSAILDGRDWIDEPTEIRLGQKIAGLVVTFTDRTTEVSGTVFDVAGRPTPDYFLVMFSMDRRFWTPGSRRVESARPDSTGSFRIANLPPGEYYLCAVTDLDSDNITDNAFLESLVNFSMKVTLADGEKKIQNVRLGGTDQ